MRAQRAQNHVSSVGANTEHGFSFVRDVKGIDAQ
jgi:hypothetical protein